MVTSKVHENQQVASETASVIEHMAGEVAQTAHANESISNASGEQIQNVYLLQETLSQLFSTLSESSAKVETTATIGDNLHNVTGILNQLMAGFTFETVNVIEPAQNERRIHPRASNRLLVKASQNGKSFECSTLDFSLTGMRLKLNKQFDDASPVELAVCLPQDDLNHYEEQQPLKLSGHITWQRFEEGINQSGVVFQNLSEEANRRLREGFEYYHKTPEFNKT